MGYLAALREEFYDLSAKARLRLSPEQCLALFRPGRLKSEHWQALKLVIGLYALGVMTWSLTAASVFGGVGFWVIYLTNWTLCLEVCYLLASTVGVFTIAHLSKDQLSDTHIRFAHAVAAVRNIVMPASVAVVIMYWVLVYTKGRPLPLAIHSHGATALFMSLDSIFGASPYRIAQSWWLYLYGVIYILFSVIYYASGARGEFGDRYIYDSLDYTKPGPTTITVVIQFVIVLPISILISWHIRYFGDSYLGNKDVPQAIADDNEDSKL